MLKKIVNIFLCALLVIMNQQIVFASSETISSDATIYEAGQYKAGVNIDPGEYVLFNNSSTKAYFCLSSDANQDNIIQNENFEYNMIVSLLDGQYIELKRCYAVAIDDVESLDLSGQGMFKIGTHLAAGEYNLIQNDSSSKAYYCIYSDINNWTIVSNNNFDGNNFVEVQDGDYLLIKRCSIENPVALFSESGSNTEENKDYSDSSDDAIATMATLYANNIIGEPSTWSYFNEQIPMPDSCIKGLQSPVIDGNSYFYILEEQTNDASIEAAEAYTLVLMIDCGLNVDSLEEIEGAILGIYSGDNLLGILARGYDESIGYYLGVSVAG